MNSPQIRIRQVPEMNIFCHFNFLYNLFKLTRAVLQVTCICHKGTAGSLQVSNSIFHSPFLNSIEYLIKKYSKMQGKNYHTRSKDLLKYTLFSICYSKLTNNFCILRSQPDQNKYSNE